MAPSNFEFIRTVSAMVVASLLLYAAPVKASDSWQSLKKSGEVADDGGDDARAIDCYSRALKLIPAQEASSVLDVEARLATDYVHHYKFAQADPLTKHILDTLPKLHAGNKLDPEVLVSVKFLSDAYHNTYDGRVAMPQRIKYFDKYEDLSLDLADLSSSAQADSEGRRYDRIRGCIYFSKRERADKMLGQLLAKMKSTSPLYMTVQLAQAAVEWSLHKPQLLEKLQKDLSKKYSEAEVLSMVSKAHLWAANYEETDKACEKGLALAAAKKPPDVETEIKLLTVYINSCDDRCLFPKSEKLARRWCDLIVYSKGKKSDDYNKAVNKLVFYLNKNNKVAEAKALKAKVPSNFDWLLDDEKKSSHSSF